MNNLTPFRRRVLEVLARHENEGTTEVALEIFGYPTHLEMHNVNRAFYWLCDHGYVDQGGPTLTDEGKRLIDDFATALDAACNRQAERVGARDFVESVFIRAKADEN